MNRSTGQGIAAIQGWVERPAGRVGGGQGTIVLLAPRLGRPRPAVARSDGREQEYPPLYRGAARDGNEASLTFADLNPYLGDGPRAAPLTDDGMHLTGAGYWRWPSPGAGAGLAPTGAGISILVKKLSAKAFESTQLV